jgi:4-hydroxy-tetrahydrodipicolinate synthase
MELPECLRAGCVGMIPAPECFDVLVAVYEAMRRETPDDDLAAERRYREVLPLIVFMMSSVDTFVCYGKRVVARRLSIDHVFDRPPCLRPSEFGLLTAERLAAALPPF